MYSQNKPCAGAFLPWSNREGRERQAPAQGRIACIPNKVSIGGDQYLWLFEKHPNSSIFALFSGQATSNACSSVGETPDKSC